MRWGLILKELFGLWLCCPVLPSCLPFSTSEVVALSAMFCWHSWWLHWALRFLTSRDSLQVHLSGYWWFGFLLDTAIDLRLSCAEEALQAN